MFASFRRHQWLWIFFFGLVIISFVVFIGPNQNIFETRGNPGVEEVGSINGEPVTRDEYANAYRESQLRYLFSYGEWPANSEMARQLGIVERETRNRLFLIRKLAEFDIQVSDSAVASWIVQAFQDRAQQVFRKEDYDRFVNETLPRQGLRPRDFQRFVRHEVGIQHLISLTGVSGKLVTPKEAELLYRMENAQADAAGVFFAATNYLAKVNMDPDAVATFFTNRQSNYRISERAQVNYVRFDATNFLAAADQRIAEMTNLTQVIEAAYLQRGTNYYRDINNQPLPPELAKEKIRSELRKEFSVMEAQKKAVEFANALYEMPPDPGNFGKMANEKGMVMHLTAPFTESQGPLELNVPQEFARSAFRLSPDLPVGEEPIVAEDGVYIIGFGRKIPSEIPPFESVRNRVVEDYRRNQSLELAQAAGREFHGQLTNSLAAGKSVQQTAAEAGHLFVDLPPFSKKTTSLPELPNRTDVSSFKDAAFALAPGEASSFNPSREGGFIVYLQAKLPVAEDRVKAEVGEFAQTLRQSRQYEAFSDWLRNETEQARIVMPGDAPAQAQN